MKIEGVHIIRGRRKGPTIAIFAGVHGNERAGVYALEKLKNELKITRGTVYLVFANPPAIEANVRMITKNLNRCFLVNNTGSSYEDLRARELMRLLDTCDALLDLHMFYDDDGESFVICENNALNIAQIFDVNIISTNWNMIEPGGTDGYMFENDKIGICIECGPISKSDEYISFAEKSVLQFLSYFKMVSNPTIASSTPKRIIKAKEVVYKNSEDYSLKLGFKNFQVLTANEEIAYEGKRVFTARANQCIIFPHYNARVGEESYILGEEL